MTPALFSVYYCGSVTPNCCQILNVYAINLYTICDILFDVAGNAAARCNMIQVVRTWFLNQ